MATTPQVDASLDWLIGACRAYLGGSGPTAPPPSWPALAQLGYLHQLEPLLHDLAGRGEPSPAAAPRAVRRRWEQALYRNFIFNAELVERTGELVRRCDRSSLRVAIFKGPVTAMRGYGALELRIMADLDLLCHPDDLSGVAEAARACGYRPNEQTADYHLGFFDPGLGAGLEIHFELYDFLPARWLRHDLWTALDRIRVDDVLLPAPAPALAAVLDLAHLLQHDLRVQLRSLLDLATTLRHLPEPQAPRWSELLLEAGLESPMQGLLGVLRGSFGWPAADGLPALPATLDGPRIEAMVIHGLLSVRDLGDRPLLAGPHRRGGPLATGRYLLRRLLPPPSRLQALYGSPSTAAALLALPRHLASILRRGWRRWRRGGLRREPGGSAKSGLNRRGAGTRRRS